MKKFNYFLSLLSLLILGVVSVQAQTTYPEWRKLYYPSEETVPYADIKFDGKTPYALRGIPANTHAPASANFLADNKYSADASNVYVFEPTGEEVDGYPTYYLKNRDNGKYLRYDLVNGEDSSDDPMPDAEPGTYVVWTLDKSRAAKLTVLQAQGDDPTKERTYCKPKTGLNPPVPSWNDNSITMIFDKRNDNGKLVSLNCIGMPSLAIYNDTRAWDIYSVSPAKSSEVLNSLLMEIGALPNLYAAGTTPGFFPKNVVDAYNSAYSKVSELTNNENASEEECEAAYNALVAAMTAANKALIMPEVGKWYYMKSGRPGFAYSDGTGLKANGSFEMPTKDNVSGEAARYWWTFTLSNDGKTYDIQDYYDKKYVGRLDGSYYTAFPMSADTVESFNITAATKISGVTGQFNIISKSNSLQWHDDGNGRVVRWEDLTAAAGGFQFIEVPADVIAASEAAIEQDKINEKMNAVLPLANSFLQKNLAYKTSFDFADLTKGSDALITSAKQLSTNAPEPSEGSLAGLIDGKIATQGSSDADLGQQYFHSAWNNTTSNDGRAHAVGIDLGKEVQSFTLRAAMRNNNGVNDLKGFNLYTSDDSVTWNYAGSYSFDYKYTCTNPEGYKDWNNWKKSTNNIGIAAVTLAKPQRYIRLEKTSDIGNTDKPFWYLSELQVFNGATEDQDPAHSPLYNAAVPAETRTAFVKAVAEANAEKPTLTYSKNEEGTVTVTVGTYKASKELYEQLNSLYNQLKQYVPDVDALNAQLDSINRVAAGMKVGTEVGFFPQASKDEFNTEFAAVEASVSPTMNIDEINAVRKQAFAAIDKFKATFNMPAVGKVYAIRCAADYSGGKAVKNAIAYSDVNDTTTWIRERGDSIKRNDQEDSIKVDVTSDLRYMWLVEKVNGKKVVLRNLGTGMYFGQADSAANNVYIPNSEVPYEQPVTFSGRSGVLNFPVADGFLVNFHGGGNGYGLVVWNVDNTVGDSVSGSAIKFEEIKADAGSFDQVGWNLGNKKIGSYQILTLPFDGETAVGDTYSVLGQKKDGDSYTLELKNTGGEFKAGVPFVYTTTEDDSLANEITLYRFTEGLQEAIDDLPNFVTTGEHESDALVGVMLNTTLKNVTSGTSVFDGTQVHAITGRESWRGYDIYGNTGYIKFVETTETGDVHIPLEAPLTTGITEAELNANSTVDVYTISGVQVRKGVKAATATAGLPAGVYVVGGQKVLVK